MLKVILLTSLSLLLSDALWSQKFSCNGSMLLSFNQGGSPNNLADIALGPFGTVIYSQINIFDGGQFDAVGYNPIDNYIYGVSVNTNRIMRIMSDGSYEVAGEVEDIDILSVSAGDCTADGRYLCHDNQLDQLLLFDVIDDFKLVERIDLYWQGDGSPFTARLDDLAVDPNQPSLAYSFQGNYFDPDLDPFARRGFLISINIDPDDPNVGMVTPIARVPEDVIRQISALYYINEGLLYGYGSTEQGPDPRQATFVSIDTRTGNVVAMDETGPTGSITDGCSCAYSLTFENDAEPRGLLCSEVETTYTLNINNRFFQDLEGISLTDTFPEGMVIEAVSNGFQGTIQEGTGVGTRFLNIDNLSIPARSQFDIKIRVRVLDLGLEFNGNQAHLRNLPERYGNSMVSDDPDTDGFLGDVTDIWIVAQDLEEFTIDIDPPTECLNANDARVYVTSPTLVPDIDYEVIIRDQDYIEEQFSVTIDDRRGFMLDSLLPGAYEIIQINTAASECSFALNDTLIYIIPPNEDVTATMTTNAPLCEGESLRLSGEMTPVGTISWEGPFDFKSAEKNTILPSVIPAQSGLYTMRARYGFCEQVKTVDVSIAENIGARISGEFTYCERDEIRLSANGKGEGLSQSWSTPSRLGEFEDDVLIIENATLDERGQYALIMDNGACQDTALAVIDILPAPSVTLPEFQTVDFCEPLILAPSVTSTTPVSFSWSPSETLSCDDCATPEVQFPMMPNYKVITTSVNSCRDSAAVKLELSTENLIYVPNIFSPNVATANHQFKMSPGCGVYQINNMSVFNRRGTRVYHEGPYTPEDQGVYWDGLIEGRIADPGVYIWHVELELQDGQIIKMYGDVTLLN